MTPITTIYFVSDCLKKKNVANKFENEIKKMFVA